MEFCPKCGALLMMRKTKAGCPRCSYVSKDKIDMEVKEEMHEQANVVVIDEKVGNVNPITDWECRKCGCKRAYFWIRQMRAGDEAESKFYECIKCKNTVRVDN